MPLSNLRVHPVVIPSKAQRTPSICPQEQVSRVRPSVSQFPYIRPKVETHFEITEKPFFSGTLPRADLGARGGGADAPPPPQEFDPNKYQRVPPLNNLLNFFSKGAFGAGVFGLYIEENFEV